MAQHFELVVARATFNSPQQEDTLVTRAELQTNREYMWRVLFDEQRTTLALAVEMLSRCCLSPEQILTKVMTAMAGSQEDC
jgi:hypothetical protein